MSCSVSALDTEPPLKHKSLFLKPFTRSQAYRGRNLEICNLPLGMFGACITTVFGFSGHFLEFRA